TCFANGKEQCIYIRVKNMGCEETSFDLKVEENAVCEEFNKQVTLDASEDSLQYTDIAVPVKDNLADGSYTVKATLSYPGREDVCSDIPVSIYSPSSEEISALLEEIKNGSLNDLPESVLNEYTRVMEEIIETETKNDNTQQIVTPVAGTENTTTTVSPQTSPGKITTFKVKAKKKSAALTWKKAADASGYEIEYSENKAFTKKKTKNVNKASTTKVKVKKLKFKKWYYFRIRAYRTVNGEKKYGAWSKVKKVKIKK
ncbi:MAG: fibronectin type III domain-containing protein, partial [Lachnospiraceae bacterium]|nr:fibronectin type III domain-containing protein [Lachnospiraceae bacterium]